ncbi:MAG: YbjN domain-containing protein [Erythrobacter sp.]
MRVWVAAVLALGLAQSASAAEKLIKAADPEGIVALLEMAGYDPELETDQFGDPDISFDLDGWTTSIAFYGCDEETHKDCESLQFIGGFDTNGSFSAEQMVELSGKHRYTQLTLDEEGDVWVRWDVLTGDGISPRLFLQNVRAFSSALDNAGEAVFAEQNAAEAATDAAQVAAEGAAEAVSE